MRNRRTIIVAFLLVAVLTIGVGFAALTDQLLATGSASIALSDTQNEFVKLVYFSKYSLDKPDSATVTIGNETGSTDADGGVNDVATITVAAGELKKENDEIKVHLTIKNDSSVPVYVSLQKEITNTEYFDVNVVYGAGSNYAIESGKDTSVTVIISCKDSPLEGDVDTTFNVYFNVSTTAPNA